MKQTQMPERLRRELFAARRMAKKATNELGGYSATIRMSDPRCIVCGARENLRVAMFLPFQHTADLFRLECGTPLRVLLYLACYECDPGQLDAEALRLLHQLTEMAGTLQ